MTRKKPVKKIGGTRRKKLPGHLQSRRLKLWGDKWARGDTLRNRQYLKKVEKSAQNVDVFGKELKQAVAPIDDDDIDGPVVHMGGDVSLEEEAKDAAQAAMEARHESALFFLSHRDTDAARHKYKNLQTLAKKEAFLIELERVFKATAEICRDRYRKKLNGVDHIRDVLTLLFLIASGKENAYAIRTIFCRRRGSFHMRQIRAGDILGVKKY